MGRTSAAATATVVATERNAILLPDAIDLEVGSVLSCALGTGFHALGRARLKPDDTVVVTGASGGVGLHTIQFARDMGYRVIAITTSDRKTAAIREAGADEVVVSPDLQFHAAVKDLTKGQGAAAVIEITGSPSFPSSIRSLGAGGRLVVVGNVQPGSVAFNPAVGILKEIELVGSSHATLDDLVRVADLVTRGRVKPEIAAVMDISDAAQGHALVAKLQILPSTDASRLVGSSRLVMTFSPVPPKNPSRHDIVVTLCGAAMSRLSAWIRAVIPSAAAWVIRVQLALPVSAAIASAGGSVIVVAAMIAMIGHRV